MLRSRYTLVALFVFVLAGALAQAEVRWPRWRGPDGTGHSVEKYLPTNWGPGDVLWKTPIEGRGQSSPIIWDDRIFLTTAKNDGRDRFVLAVDRKTGKILWEQRVDWSGEPEKLHKMNSWASSSCVTDGERVYAFFGKAGLHCYTVDGKHVWSVNLGVFDGPWGVAACPVLFGDLLIQNGDADMGAFIAAFDKRTGKEVWRETRPDHRGWSTPILITANNRQELVLNGHEGVTAYDPMTGKQLWFCKSFNGRGEPTATPGESMVYLVNGQPGDIYAVKPGGDGNVTSSHMAWHTTRRSGRDLPSPILIGKFLLVSSMGGVCTCYDSTTGAVLWNDRLGGNYSASPIAANRLAYFQAEDGTVVVIEPGPELKIVARNEIESADDELFRGSLAPCEGQIFARSDKALYCIGKK